MLEHLKTRFQKLMPSVDFCAMRALNSRSQRLSMRQNVLQPLMNTEQHGVLITIIDKGGYGYAATSDLSEQGLKNALENAQHWAKQTRQRLVVDFDKIALPHLQGKYQTPLQTPWEQVSLADKIAVLQQESELCQIHEHIVDWQFSLKSIEEQQLYVTNHGGEIIQQHHYLLPDIQITAYDGTDSQKRSFNAHGNSQQGGLERLQAVGFIGAGQRLAHEALQLLAAPNCPTGAMSLLLAPDQMMLQIHESIGHPLELDRILGDERNYAGTSFVTLDMFGHYRYGSDVLNVTFDPTIPEQLASYAYDDEGSTAEKTYLIRDGILQRPLGGTLSQQRAGLSGVANSRSSNWNRAPIDRMANLNIEAGKHSLQAMIASVENGVFMQTNQSWSIDDSRNKFQFGCEWGQRIENGELTHLVKKPNYRGISATFWRNLQHVGAAETVKVYGVPFCGKGEPSQLIRVGHASPACLFSQVDVFGGV